MKNKNREIIKIDESFGDQTGQGPWDYKNEIYSKINEVKRHGDGQETDVIVQRKSDNKYFKFTWTYFPDSCSDDYEFDNELCEVFPNSMIITYE